MRTTLDIDDALLSKARREAARRGTTLTAVVEDALALALAPRSAGAPSYHLSWKAHRGRYIGGVDIADRVALYDLLDAER